MASAPPRKSGDTQGPLVPPDEQFWKRYSPHGEAPTSMIGSVALHALVFGGLALGALFVGLLINQAPRSLPIEPVRLAGGGGSKTGVNGGNGGPQEDVGPGQPGEASQPGAEEAPARPSLNPVETARVNETYEADAARLIQRTESGKAIARLSDSIRKKLRLAAPPGKGQGGSGKDGGKGTGAGPGTGDASGPGKATLNKREKRMLRWHMRFTASTGSEYLAQLRSLGAILAFPVREGDDPQFKVVHDLRPGAPLLDEDVSRIQRIYWIDDNPRSVRDVLGALGHPNLRPPPGRLVAFMPEELESKLFAMERKYVEDVLRKPFDENRIEETNFRVVRGAGGWRPELVHVRMR
jgi:hypothetical protein